MLPLRVCISMSMCVCMCVSVWVSAKKPPKTSGAVVAFRPLRRRDPCAPEQEPSESIFSRAADTFNDSYDASNVLHLPFA